MPEPLLFEISSPGRIGVNLPECDVPETELPKELLRDKLSLPEVSEVDLVRHYIRLSQLNWGVDVGFYPLGSCTMKYNPKVNEEAAKLPGFSRIHPYQDEETVQGALQLMYELQEFLKEISGFAGVSLQPAAGAHGELTGILMMRAYHEERGDAGRTKVLVPDSAHGTNPASSAMSGCQVVEIKSDERGNVDLDELKAHCDETVVGLMLTNPSTLGLFEEHVLEVAEIIHDCGGLMFCDGANMNSLLGIAKPCEMGCDVMMFNLHKTFSTPHGGGGPGSGPVGVKAHLAGLLPVPRIVKENGRYALKEDVEESIGRVHPWFGNFNVFVKAYAYIKALGGEGLREVSENAIINANYLMKKIAADYDIKYPGRCMHEFVASARNLKKYGVRTLDVAKRLLDYGLHAPTVYFPLIVEEALMIEPVETEKKETLDRFAEVMAKIAGEARDEPQLLHEAPLTTPVRRLDEAAAARCPELSWPGGESLPMEE